MVKALSISGIAFGVVGSALPTVLISTYGSEPTPAARLLARLWGNRNLAFSVLAMQLEGEALDTLLRTAVLSSLADTTFGLLAKPVDGLPSGTGAATAVTGGIFAALYAYALSLD